MNKFLAVASSVVLAGASLVGGVETASAAPSHMQYDSAIQNVCHSRMSDPGCRDWSTNHNHWSDAQYRSWYGAHRSWNWGPGAGIAGLFGFAAGAIIAGAAANASNGAALSAHQQRCAAKYRSYNASTDLYVYDSAGHTRQCSL